MEFKLTRRETFKAAAGLAAVACLPGMVVASDPPIIAMHIGWAAALGLVEDFHTGFSGTFADIPQVADLQHGMVRVKFQIVRGERGEYREPWQVADFPIADDGTADLPHGFVLHISSMEYAHHAT